MIRRTSLALAVLALSVGATSCASQTCTEAGCTDGLTFHFDERVPRDYTLTIEVAGKVGTADCTAAALADTSAELQVQLTGELDLGVWCSPDFVTIEDSPGSLAMTLTFPDGTTTNADAKPVYEEVFPNGEDCPPTCEQASFDIDVHPPKG